MAARLILSDRRKLCRDGLRFVLRSFLFFGILVPSAYAGPQGGTVVGGQVSIQTPTAQTTIVQQQSQRGIINWNSFSLGANEVLRFLQPGSSSITLNRVTGTGPSTVDGLLSANGQVWIVNPSGVLFGRNAQVNVGGLLASTTDIGDANFMAGSYLFNAASGVAGAGIDSLGTLQAGPGGSIVLAGSRVTNDGVIEARLGSVVLGGAKTFTVDLVGDNLVKFAIAAPVDQAPAGGGPLVNNTGKIIADGGQVLVTAKAAAAITSNLISSTGLVQANGVSITNGVVTLDGGDGGVVVGGQVSAKGTQPNETGGSVAITGGSVAVAPGTTIDASGPAGGGGIAVGSWQANAVDVGAGSRLDASTTVNGNGGNISVIGGAARVAGQIVAEGGPQGGKGGQVETSGHSLDIGAASVKAGRWLLDPADFVIDTTAASSIVSALNGGATVTVQTGTGGSTCSSGCATGTGGATNGDITVSAPIAAAPSITGAALILNAYGNVVVNQSITSTGNPLALALNHGASGSATLATSIDLAGGALNVGTFNGSTATSGAGTLNVTGGTTSLAGTFAASTLNIAGGVLSLNGTGPTTLAAVMLSNGTLNNADVLNIGTLTASPTYNGTVTLGGAGAVNLTGVGTANAAGHSCGMGCYSAVGGTLTIDGGKVLTNTATGSFEESGFMIFGPVTVALANGSSIVNAGTWTLGSGNWV